MLRWNLILAGAPLGLALGLITWLMAGGASANSDKLAPLASKVNALRAPRAIDEHRFVGLPDLQSIPIFALTVGPGAVQEPSVRLEGISVSSRRTAALISIEGRPSEWLVVGDTRDGVTLQQVRGSRILIDTVFGSKEVALAEQNTPGPPVEAAMLPEAKAAPDRTPPGFRTPPPPASAPK